MTEWTFMEKLFWFFAIPSTLVFLIQLGLSLICGVDHHDGDVGQHEFSHDSVDGGIDAPSVFSFLSLSFKNVVSFCMGFGWAGILAFKLDFGAFGCLLLATVGGVAFMLLSASLMWILYKLESYKPEDIMEAIGKVGQVYITVRPQGESPLGEVTVALRNAFRNKLAVSNSDKQFPAGTYVKVVSTSGNLLIVGPND